MLKFFIVSLFLIDVEANFELVILHTNDVHGRVEEMNIRGGTCSKSDAQGGECYGGVARRKTAVDVERSRHENVLLLDAGDQFQGTVWFNYYKGMEAALFMNMLEYDAMSLGNHEFDNGIPGLLPFLANTTFPVLACNVDASREPDLDALLHPYVVLTMGEYKIGVIGYVTEMTRAIVDPVLVESLTFLPEVSSVRSAAREVKVEHGADLVIVLGHGGVALDEEIAGSVEEVDVVVGGHSNTLLYTGRAPSNDVAVGPYPTIVTQASGKKVPVVHDFAYGKYLGKLMLEFDDNLTLENWGGNPILLNSSIEQDAAVLSVVEKMSVGVAAFRRTAVGESLVYLDGERLHCRTRECNLGNVLTDAIVEINMRGATEGGWAQSAIAVWHAGGIRASIDPGVVSLEDVLTAFPFSNEIVKLTVSGTTLIEMLERSVSDYDVNEPSGAFLQVSGLRVVYDLTRAPRSRVVSAHVLCVHCLVPHYKAVNDSARYTIHTSGFVANGGDGYSMLREDALERENLGYLFTDQFMEYLTAHSPVYPALEGRIKLLNSTPPSCEENVSNNATNDNKRFLVTICSLVICILLMGQNKS